MTAQSEKRVTMTNLLLTVSAFLLSLVLGMGSYFGRAALTKLDDTGSKVLVAVTKIEVLSERVNSLERKLDEALPRREFDTRIAEIQAKLRQLDVEILRLKESLAK